MEEIANPMRAAYTKNVILAAFMLKELIRTDIKIHTPNGANITTHDKGEAYKRVPKLVNITPLLLRA